MSDMKNKGEDLLGSAKEAIGDATGNEKLENEGKADQVKASVKDAVEDVKEKAEHVVDEVISKFKK